MDTCMSSIVKNSFKGIDTVQQVQSFSDSFGVVDNLIKVFFIVQRQSWVGRLWAALINSLLPEG